MKLIRVKTDTAQVIEENWPSEYERLGGRAFTSNLVSREVSPLCHPLSKYNKLVIAPGLLAGTNAPCCNKLSIGAKSPLTRGIKESNVGGRVAYRMARLGIGAIVIENKPIESHPHILVLSTTRPRMERIDEFAGLGNYDLHRRLQELYGPRAAILSIGPAGELQIGGACIMSSDIDDRPSRAAGRGGLGAVMGSKGIKAIVIPHSRSEKPVSVSNAQRFKKASKEFTEFLIKTKAVLTKYGTANMVDVANGVAGLPTRNYRSGTFEGVEKINAESLYNTIMNRGGSTSEACTPGCPIRCSNIYNDQEAKYLTSSLEYETICLVGSNLGIDNLDYIARLDRLCDDAGLDTIETGVTLGLAMEIGLIKFGDGEAAIKLVEEVYKGTVMGRLIGGGATLFAGVYGVDRVPAVKGQSLAAYDPRTFKAMGATFATSPMGSDHTAGPAIPGRKGLDLDKEYILTNAEGQVELSRDLQILVSIIDQLGFCLFVGPELKNLPRFKEFLTARFGWEISEEEIIEMGKAVLRAEVDFNHRAGIYRSNDDLPEWLRTEPLEPSGRVFDIGADELRNMGY